MNTRTGALDRVRYELMIDISLVAKSLLYKSVEGLVRCIEITSVDPLSPQHYSFSIVFVSSCFQVKISSRSLNSGKR